MEHNVSVSKDIKVKEVHVNQCAIMPMNNSTKLPISVTANMDLLN
jgi:hypothetical protein